MNISYAVQVCDTKSNLDHKRITGTSKTEITKRCIRSFVKSLIYVDLVKNIFKSECIEQKVLFVMDNCSPEVVTLVENICNSICSPRLSFEVNYLSNGTLRKSIERTYNYLIDSNSDLVYQVQDDYLFYETSLYEMIDLFFQVRQDCQTDCIISSYNPPLYWTSGDYRYKPTPRVIVPGIKRYWIQTYDIACTFLTSSTQFKNHIDLYEQFYDLLPHGDENNKLESLSLNKMFVERGVLGLLPINSVAFHLQSEFERDVYQDWNTLWEQYKI